MPSQKLASIKQLIANRLQFPDAKRTKGSGKLHRCGGGDRFSRDSKLQFGQPNRFMRGQSPGANCSWTDHSQARESMFGRKEKKHSLYYLLPGMTRANREKRRRVFWWSVAVGVLASGLIAAIIFLINRGPRP